MERHTQNELNSILGNFSIAPGKYTLVPIKQGYINDTFLVQENHDPLYVLQRINHDVFPNVQGIMHNIDEAFRFLKSEDYHNIELLPTVSGKSYFTCRNHEESYWRLMTYKRHSETHNTTESPKIAHGAGKIIGEFHRLLDQANPESFVDVIPGFHNLAFREHQFKNSLLHGNPTRIQSARTAIAYAKEVLGVLQEFDLEQFPVRICHNDTKLNNILFSSETKVPLCLIDLDTLMRGLFLYDFGDAVRTIVNTAPEDEQVHDKIVFECGLFDAFVEGLASVGPLLTAKEIEGLPLGVVLMPFLHGIRALTDFLNNDVYYKVAYENQNLDRCLSLFNFTQKALGQMDYMKRSVFSTLKAAPPKAS